MTGYVLWMTRLVTAVAVAMSLFHLYIAYAGPPNAFTLRATHFGFALVLAFLILPLRRPDEVAQQQRVRADRRRQGHES